MSNPVLEILIVLVLLIANGSLAMSEAAFISARKARLQQLANTGNAQARAALALATNTNQFLATVQIGITLTGILLGAFGGVTIAKEIADYLSVFPFLAPYSETIGLSAVVLSLTYFSLIIGELVPKRLALNYAERIACGVAAPMRLLSLITAPVVWILSVSTDIVMRLLGVKPSAERTITQEEIKVLIEEGTESGVFEEAEQNMIESVLRLDERRVGAFMTPRMQIVWLGIEDSPEVVRRKITNSRHSRFPVIKGNLDKVIGIVSAKDLLTQSLANQQLDLMAGLHAPLFIPENMSALQVLELFKQKGTPIALVTDEYGGIQGMVTHNDILEAIVGYIHTAGVPAMPEATRREDGSWLLDGLLPIDKLKEIFDLEQLPDEEHAHYQTVGGFVMTQIRKIPMVGQRFEWGTLYFEVIDMDGRRVDKVLVTSSPAEESPSS